MDRFLIKVAFGSEKLIRGRRGACLRVTLIRGNAARLIMLSIVVSKTQNKLRKGCI